ncbi:MAG TPA: hypothetical protein VI685_25325 [Candidatus Angelobacter sp.]
MSRMRQIDDLAREKGLVVVSSDDPTTGVPDARIAWWGGGDRGPRRALRVAGWW